MKKLYLLVIAVCGMFLSQGSALAVNLNFTLKNATGHEIVGLYISPHSSDSWGSNWLEESIDNGSETNVEFLRSETHIYWDIKVVYGDGSADTFTSGYNLAKIYYIRLGYDDDGQPRITYTFYRR